CAAIAGRRRAPRSAKRRSCVSTAATKSGRTTGRAATSWCFSPPTAAPRRAACAFRPIEAHAGLELLEDGVARLLHAEGAVDAPRTRVVMIDVEPKADHGAPVRREALHVAVEAPIDAA